MAYYNESAAKVLEDLRVDHVGLSSAQVKTRQERIGRNVLQAKRKINIFLLILRQFKSFIIYILLFALVISVLSDEIAETLVILIAVILNAVIGFFQEYRAEKAIDALQELSILQVRVLRDGKEQLIDARELVPGDIIFLEEGSKVPADGRIIETINCTVSEASLTGESMGVSKHDRALKGGLPLADQANMVFSGTVILSGRVKVVVTKTGMETEIGHIAGMIADVEQKPTPLQEKLDRLGKWIGIVIIAVCVIVFLTGIIGDGLVTVLFSGDIMGFIFAAREWFLTAVALAVAAVPGGLPAVVTISLALGVKAMLKRHALVRRLPSVETLGESTVICTDKTGTLTKNEMTVRKAYTNGKELTLLGDGYVPVGEVLAKGRHAPSVHDRFVFLLGTLCNDAALVQDNEQWSIVGDPTEGALLVSAEKLGIDTRKETSSHKPHQRFDELPFDSVRKMMSTLHKGEKKNTYLLATKGAPEQVIKQCNRIRIDGKVIPLAASLRKNILQQNERMAKDALRVLAFAYKEQRTTEMAEEKLIFVGLQGMMDPPHHEVSDAISRCHGAGIRVIMITGDNGSTAKAIANMVGIKGKAMEGTTFEHLSPQLQKKALAETNIFSRVEPVHKLRIVELLQAQGEIVAMTGDGVNDAPALKKADLGVAMGVTGTDVAKEVADMVLIDDKFTSIVNAIEEGRGIDINIKKFINYLLSGNIAEVLIIFLTILFGMPLPMTAIMLIWLNLVTDGMPAIALSIDPNPAGIMERPPKRHKHILSKGLTFSIVSVAILITLAVMAIIRWAAWRYDGASAVMHLQTITFTAVVVMELVRIHAIRREYRLSLSSNLWLVLAIGSSLVLQLLVIYTPLNVFFGTVHLSFADWTVIVAASIVVYFLTKLIRPLRRAIPSLR